MQKLKPNLMNIQPFSFCFIRVFMATLTDFNAFDENCGDSYTLTLSKVPLLSNFTQIDECFCPDIYELRS